jgi:ferrous iron transport protein B
MKKLLAVLLAVITVGCVFVACSKADDKKETTTKSESTSFTVQNPTDKAKIKDKDAIDFIKNAYTPEELYVRKHLNEEQPDIVINVVDASNLERNLYLTCQLIDMDVRMVIALNMYDELEASGNTLDYVKLGQLFGVPMLPTISRTGKGIEQLFHIIIGIYEGGDFLDKKGKIRAEILNDLRNWHKEYVPDHDFGTHKEEKEHPAGFYRHIHINHGPELERSIEEVKRIISVNENIRYKYSTRFLAIKLLENDEDLEKTVQEFPNGKDIIEVRNREVQRLRNAINEDSEQAITDAKYGFIAGALRETYVDKQEDTARTTRVIDSIVTHYTVRFRHIQD